MAAGHPVPWPVAVAAVIDVLVMTDGRDAELHTTLLSVDRHVLAPAGEVWMHDDTGDDTHRDMLTDRYPRARVIGSGPRRGFGGAIAYAWAVVAACTRSTWLFHVEGDFKFRRHVDLAAMAATLAAHPHLVQMALRRQPWSSAEVAAGGVVEQAPDDYADQEWVGHRWLEHRRFYTTNPHVVPMRLVRQGWPAGSQSEGRFAAHLFGANPDARAGYWGARSDPPWVEHIGLQRVGTGY